MKSLRLLLHITLILVLPALVLARSPLFAESKHATKDEAQAMATKAAASSKRKGLTRRWQPSTQAVAGVTVISMFLSSTKQGHGEPAERGLNWLARMTSTRLMPMASSS